MKSHTKAIHSAPLNGINILLRAALSLLSLSCILASPLAAQDGKFTEDLEKLADQKRNAEAAALKPIQEKYKQALAELEKKAAASGDYSTAKTIREILDGTGGSEAKEPAGGKMAEMFPVGSEWTGTWSAEFNEEQKVSYKVVESNGNSALVSFVNDHGSWNLRFLLLPGGKVRLEKVESVKAGFSFPSVDIAGEFAKSDVGGKDRLELGGKWTFQEKGKAPKTERRVKFSMIRQ